MKNLSLILLSFLFTSFSSYGSEKPLTIERLFESPELEGAKMMGLKFSPNGQRLSFLKPKKSNYEVLDLWEFDLKTGKESLLVDSATLKFSPPTEIEKARLERMRITRQGIVEYFWSEKGDLIAFPAGGDLYLYSFSKPLKRLTNNAGAELDIRFSPQDNYLTYTREQNLYLMNLKDQKEIPLTTTGKDSLSFGSAEFIAQEEMHRRDGYWWSADEKWIAFTEVNEDKVKLVDRFEINADGVTVRKQRYPEAGSANAQVRLGLIKVEDALKGQINPLWIPFGKEQDIYLARAQWTEEGQLIYQIQSRDQKTLDIMAFNPMNQQVTKLRREIHPHWVNLHDNWYWLKKNQNWIWASEKSGFNHLYLLDRKGQVVRQLTQGLWPVIELVGVDEKNDWVYFSAGIKSPLERHLYRVSMSNPKEPEPITEGSDWNSVVMDKEANYFIRIFSNPRSPHQISLHRASGELVSNLLENSVNEKHPFYPYQKNYVEPEFGFFKGPSKENIYYSLYKPKGFDPQKKYPLIVYGYGGPGTHLVGQHWPSRNGLFANVLTTKGFVVATFDNRGSNDRGRKFEDALYRAFGTVEVEDQKAGVEYLIQQGFIDPTRVGFYGWSYGGYLSLMLAAKAPETFKANVAVAPVTDFALYDTHYTERFMGIPSENKKAYKRANVLEFVPQIKGKLLVIHGMADDNVLFTNSTILFKTLQENGILYESVTYPGSKHGISGKLNQTHVHKTIADFFERHLLNDKNESLKK